MRLRGVHESYNNGVTDEFIEPFVCVDDNGEPVGRIEDHDAVICFNYRADRVRQITRVLTRNSGLAADGGASLPKAAELGRGDSAVARAERVALCDDDAVRQELCVADGDSAGEHG